MVICRFEATDHFVGIDFGTTHCSIGYMDGNKFRLVKDKQGLSRTPSCVAFSAEGFNIGSQAVDCLTMDPDNTVFGKNLILQ